ncbi:MAG: sulfur carrier protein ThiS [Phycisphaerales bacterium]
MITVNGEELAIENHCTVAELLVRVGIAPPCAVEVNRTVVPFRDHPDHQVGPGDVVEIVTFVGGG